MKVTYSWLKEYLDLKIKPDKLAEALTMAGLEVTSLYQSGGDWVLEIEVTSNRPDWLSVIGVAREIVAITGCKFKPSVAKSKKIQIEKATSQIKILDKDGCKQYMGTVIRGIKIKPSPEWMQKRLRAIGLRPINNVVDVTNYVLYETGQPLHAFDLDKLTPPANIIVRRAKDKEKITTLDGKEGILDSDVLVIADSNRPIAIAGVIGGVDTEVDDNTKNILLESAEFDPVLIRRGAKRLAVSTDSSYRFERKVDPCGITNAAQRAIGLILELSGGEVASSKIQKIKDKDKDIKLSLSINKVKKVLGTDIGLPKIKKILTALGFGLSKTPPSDPSLKGTGKVYPSGSKALGGSIPVDKKGKDILTVSVPCFRSDVTVCEDLIEEVARIYGYDKIPNTLPYILPRAINPQDIEDVKKHNLDPRLIKMIKDSLVGLGFNEVINYSLVPDDISSEEDRLKAVKVANPLSKDQQYLRTNIFPGLLNNITYNKNRKNVRIKIFELGNVFKDSNGYSEKLSLGLAVSGQAISDWQRPDKTPLSFFDLKGCIGQLLLRLGVSEAEFIPIASSSPEFPRFRIMIRGEAIGAIAQDSPDTCIAEIFFMDKLAALFNPEKKFKPYSVYPSIRRDISLLLKKDIPYAKVSGIITSVGKEMVSDVKLIEQYSGEHVPEHCKSLLLSVQYSSSERTLTDEEVDVVHRKILDNLVEKLGVKVR